MIFKKRQYFGIGFWEDLFMKKLSWIRSKKVVWFAAVFLLLCMSVLFWKRDIYSVISVIRKENIPLRSIEEDLFFGLTIPDSTFPSKSLSSRFKNSEIVSQHFDESKAVMYIFFSPLDCATCLLEARLWNKIDEEFKNRLVVFGVAHETDRFLLDAFIKRKGIKFQVFLDEYQQVYHELNLNFSPVLLLVDKESKIRIIHRSTNSKIGQEKFYEDLKNLIDKSEI